MKGTLICLLLVIITARTFAQQTTTSAPLTKDEYLQKSKHQKTAAWIMLGGGLALGVGGVAVSASNWESSGGDVMLVIGGAVVVSSIPLFIASAKSKRKAMQLSFKNETAPQMQKSNLVYKPIPSLSLKINL